MVSGGMEGLAVSGLLGGMNRQPPNLTLCGASPAKSKKPSRGIGFRFNVLTTVISW